MLNIVTNELPSTIEVGGFSYAIETDFRVGMQVTLIADDPTLPPYIQARAILEQYGVLQHVNKLNFAELTEACMDFYNLEGVGFMYKRAGSNIKRKQKRIFDFTFDSALLVSDFMREYQIDLTDNDLYMHWWRFYALFQGLSDASRMMDAMSTRSSEIPKGASKEERKYLREKKRAVELPAKSIEEFEERTREAWGI